MAVHQFLCILHFCHTCSLCRVNLVVQFPARGSTQVLLCLFPGVLWLWHFLYNVGPHPVSNLYIYTFVVSRTFMAGAASQVGDADSPEHMVSPLVCRGPWMSTVLLYCWCHSDSSSVLLYFTLVNIKYMYWPGRWCILTSYFARYNKRIDNFPFGQHGKMKIPWPGALGALTWPQPTASVKSDYLEYQVSGPSFYHVGIIGNY